MSESSGRETSAGSEPNTDHETSAAPERRTDHATAAAPEPRTEHQTSAAPERRPRVGVGVLVLQQDYVLLGLRRGAHGAGTWSPPGGHLEFGEDPVACARREAREEAGIELEACEFAGLTNDVFATEGLHYVTLFYKSTHFRGVPSVREPEKCEAWQWWPWQSLPANLFLSLANFRRGRAFVPS